MKTIDIAKATHEMNRLYCKILGDYSQVPWDEAPDWQRESAIAGVQAILDGTARSPAQQHYMWEQQKLAEGWVYGPVKDAEKKTHPCLVPYMELPPSQRAKDAIFQAVVQGLRDDNDRSPRNP